MIMVLTYTINWKNKENVPFKKKLTKEDAVLIGNINTNSGHY